MGGQNRPFCKRNRFHKTSGENMPGGKKAQDDGELFVAEYQSAGRGTFYKTMECAAGQCHYYEYPYLPGNFSAEGADADTC